MDTGVKGQCPICLDDGCLITTLCDHHFHSKCLVAWKRGKDNPDCPMCRKPLNPYVKEETKNVFQDIMAIYNMLIGMGIREQDIEVIRIN